MLKTRKKIAGSSFQHCMGGGGKFRPLNLCSRLACAQKRQKCKFALRLDFQLKNKM